MEYQLIPFTHEYLEQAVALFLENYKREQEHSPFLPPRVIDEPVWIRDTLQSRLTSPGVVVVQQNQLLAYMVTGVQFPWKGQQAVLVPEYCHSAVATQKRELYQHMYMSLAQTWVDDHRHLHLIGHFAHDSVLLENLYQLGFGAIVAERLRDLSAVPVERDVPVFEEQDVNTLINLQIEHNHYYPKSPIFILKDTEESAIRADLEAHQRQGDVFLVYKENGEPCACMIVGTSTIGGEGFLLQHTNTAQIKSAYARQDVRGKGIGKALLRYAIQWSQEHGYDRLFVEHETANMYGGNFWRKHFTPYIYFSMRYVDNTI
jgi:GNAT superfamily N-acetyltransferase